MVQGTTITGGLAVKVYIVYRIDHIRHERETVGAVLERRNGDRGNDIKGLLQLAQYIYSAPAPDSQVRPPSIRHVLFPKKTVPNLCQRGIKFIHSH